MALLRPLILGCGLGAALSLAALPQPAAAAPPEGARGEAPRRGEAGLLDQARRARAAGPTQHGKASYYHRRFNGRRMANGDRFDPNAAIAAHKTLPFGTYVRVTNLANGKSAVARVTDRGPFVRGRIIDLAPHLAERLEMKRDGVVQVAVTPLALPAETVAEAP